MDYLLDCIRSTQAAEGIYAFTGLDEKGEADPNMVTYGKKAPGKLYGPIHPKGYDEENRFVKKYRKFRYEELQKEYEAKFGNDIPLHLEEIFLDLMQKGREGYWLGESCGAAFWGGYFYMQTVEQITGVKIHDLWKVVDDLVEKKLISLEGAVIRDFMEEIKIKDIPIMDWDNPKDLLPGVIWWEKLDERYQVEVHEAGDKGKLLIFDKNNNYKLIYKEEVGLMSGAVFGPDTTDVSNWQERAKEAVEGLIL